MAFVTDSGVYPMPAVQDFKRALEGDRGGNTGGMGSYSQRDHLLPFLSAADRDRAIAIIEKTAAALRTEGLSYRGILYGGFMLTANGPKLLEFNARFGDPEGVNALTLYEEGDFADLLYGVASGKVDPNLVQFRRRATVVKYIVPPGYGDRSRPGGLVTVDAGAIEAAGVHLLYGSVDAAGPATVRLGTSRGLALVGEASAIHEAGTRVEAALAFVQGEYLRTARHRDEGGPRPALGAHAEDPRPERQGLAASAVRRSGRGPAVKRRLPRAGHRLRRGRPSVKYRTTAF